MKYASSLARQLDLTEGKSEYDSSCKKLLADKTILAWIMKSCIEEYRDCTIEEIKTCIVEEPVLSKITVHQDELDVDETEALIGLNTEDDSVKEGKITYDIRYAAIVPKSGEWIGLIINLEAHNNFYPGYPLIKRGIYYCSRMISAQYGTEFTNSHYEKIKKVYSIWVCPSPPLYRENTINKYSIAEEQIVGEAAEPVENYDLMTVLIICLGKFDSPKSTGILRLLEVLLADRRTAKEKKTILQNEFGIAMTKEMKKETEKMSSLLEGAVMRYLEEERTEARAEGIAAGRAEGIAAGRAEGIAAGRAEGIAAGRMEGTVNAIKKLMCNQHLTMEQAMGVLDVPKEECSRYAEMLLEEAG